MNERMLMSTVITLPSVIICDDICNLQKHKYNTMSIKYPYFINYNKTDQLVYE